MKDIQITKPEKKIDIDEVGIKRLKVPLIVMDKKQEKQSTFGMVDLLVNLRSRYKGTHMSRFVEILNKYLKKTLSIKVVDKLVVEVMNSLNAKMCKLRIEFPYFVSKQSPVSKKKSLLGYQCKIIRIANKGIDKIEHIVEVKVPISITCPCSKEISKYGAHNQRAIVTMTLKINKLLWIEEIIKIAEEEASSPVYSLLKREDEKYVTEKSYGNPKFVEDIVRGIAFELNKLKKKRVVENYNVECESMESIHNHNAYASIKG